MELALIIGNLLLLVGKFVWDWWSGKKERERIAKELWERDKKMATLALEKARRTSKEDNAGLVKLEDEVDAWLNRPVE